MGGAIIENLSGRKLSVLIALLMICQLCCFLLGGLIAPAPTSASTVLGTKCYDRNYNSSKWYQSRPVKQMCHSFDSLDELESGITADDIIFVFQVPIPREKTILDFSRWQQNLIGTLIPEVFYDENDTGKQPSSQHDIETQLTVDARLAYQNKGDPDDKWTPLASSVEERKLECSILAEHRKPGYQYSCSLIPLFELGSLHHDFYLLNLRLPNKLAGKEVNRGLSRLENLMVAFINQNGGFTKVWVSLKTVFFPLVVVALVWFWRRICLLARPPALLECCILELGAALTLLNLPLEYLTLLVDCPWMTVLGDIRQGVFYASLLSFWLIFAGEHLMDEVERNRLRAYWRHLSAVLGGCVCLFIFDMCERGVQLTNPFYSIWVTDIGTNLALAFIILAGICAGLYFCFLSYMIWKVFVNISAKRNSLTAMSSNRRLKYQGIIYRFKALMLATLLCAAMTVIGFILGQVSEGRWKWDEDISLEYTSAFFTGVYGMWNVYTLALLCLYAPSHKKWPREESVQSIHGELLARDQLNSQSEEIEFSRFAAEPSELSALTALAGKPATD
ncbi:protein wntless isoform X2 [Hyalella azteca]|uniref:Protein wntless n=1 Tax=Hyalella azteca TaxID=294128 RepID=A0A8B7N287_HYAAZ|nr:protein wntless isoform X2 [Hyalella azteca]